MPGFKDITSQRFGRLTAIRRTGTKTKIAIWLCRCECGNEIIVPGIALRSGNTKSCGCLHDDMVRERNIARTRHGHARGYSPSKTHQAWAAMKSRCSDPNNPAFKNYGARGITVCERWLSFENFLADMGEAPPGLCLERIDNDRSYAPGNCCWSTYRMQANNRRSNRHITINGVTMTVAQWAHHFHADVGLARNRIRRGWLAERAFTEPATRR